MAQMILRRMILTPCKVFNRLAKDLVYIVHVCRDERGLRKFLIELGSLS
jgi:toxin ParE1/3/4